MAAGEQRAAVRQGRRPGEVPTGGSAALDGESALWGIAPRRPKVRLNRASGRTRSIQILLVLLYPNRLGYVHG